VGELRRDVFESGVEDQVDLLLGLSRRDDDGANGRSSRRSPHEVRRVKRQVSVSFPSVGWVARLREVARAYGEGVYVADLIVLAVSEFLERVEGGAAGRPPMRRREAHFRTGQVFEGLPWRPEGEE